MDAKRLLAIENTLGPVDVMDRIAVAPAVEPAKLSPAPWEGKASAEDFTGKRVLDVLGALALLVVVAPLMAFVAMVLKLSGDGPAIFWQQRIGLDGRPFWFPKFSSMQPGSEELHDRMVALNDHKDSVTFKMRLDPRVTRIGRILRITSIDELPQLWSVLRGDMSLVGPRPPLPGEVARYTPAHWRRLDVKPGMTCIWQVSGRSEIGFDEQVLLDIEYIENRSLRLDLELILMTIPAVLSCRGAY